MTEHSFTMRPLQGLQDDMGQELFEKLISNRPVLMLDLIRIWIKAGAPILEVRLQIR